MSRRFRNPDRTTIRIPAINPVRPPDYAYLHLDEDGGLLIVDAPASPDPLAKLRL